MKKVSLEIEDRRFLKEEILQVILMNLAILIVISIAGFGLIILIRKAQLGLNSSLVFSILALAYFVYFIYSILPGLRELNYDTKGVMEG